GLAHPGDDHAARTGEYPFDGGGKRLIQPIAHGGQRCNLLAKKIAARAQRLELRVRYRVPLTGCAHLRHPWLSRASMPWRRKMVREYRNRSPNGQRRFYRANSPQVAISQWVAQGFPIPDACARRSPVAGPEAQI